MAFSRPQRQRSRRRAARALRPLSEAALWAALIFAPAAFGASAPWALWTLLALAALALGSALADAYLSRRRLRGSLPALALAVLTVAVGIQCLPIPPGLLARLSPAADDLFRFTLGPKGLYPAWRPLSLDPPATAIELGKALIELSIFLAAAQAARSRAARRRLGMGVALLGALLAATAFLHQLFGMTALFGFARLARAGLVSPFVNRNHLASALELGALVQLGLAVRTRDKRLAFAWGLAFVFTGAAVMLAGSRAGSISFLAGGLVFASLVWIKRPQGGDANLFRHRVALGLCFLAGVVAVAVFLNADALMGQVESLPGLQHTHALPQIWPTVVPMVREHWLTGVGRGAFKVAFPRYQQAFPEVTFTHPENVLLQLTSELGVVLGLGLLVLLAGAWAEIARRGDLSAGEGGLLAGLFAVGLHEFADFGLEMAGVAIPALIALAVVSTRPGSGRRVSRAWGAALFVLLLAAGSWGLAQAPHEVAHDRDAVDAAVHGGASLDAVTDATWQALARHPSDYVLALDAAVASARARPPRPDRALFWANRAMYLDPLSAWPHRLAAEALFLLGRRPQAMLEEQLAMPSFVGDPSFEADLRRFLRSPEEFAALAPPTPEGLELVLRLTASDPKLSLRAGELALSKVTLESLRPLLRLSESARRVGEKDLALAYARRALAASPNQPDGYQSVAAAQDALGQVVDAEATLRDGLRIAPGSLNLTVALANLLAGRKEFDEAHRLLRQVTPRAPNERVYALDADAALWRAQGLDANAIAALREAAAILPNDPNRQYQLAQLLQSMGRTREAMAAIDRGLGIDHTDGRDQSAAWRAKLAAQAEAEDRERLLKSLDQRSERPGPGDADPEH